MKVVNGKIGLILRLGVVVAALLLGQQSLAIGTDAGTSIDNTVNVDYDVGGIDQTDLTSTVSFVVDRRVDFTLTQLGGALVPVIPGQLDAFFDLLLTNTSNSTLDFNLVLDQAGVVTVRGVPDTADMTSPEYAVSALPVSGGDPDPLQGGAQYVDELLEDDAIRIRVWGDAALTLLNGLVAGIQIDATAAEPGAAGTEGTALVDGLPNGDLTIENVFADLADGVGGVEIQTDGFIVVTAALVVTKSYLVIAGDLGSGLPIPGATIEYTVTVVNSSVTAADAVIFTDTIDADVVLQLNVAAYAGNDIDVVNDVTTLSCDIEINGDGDGCDSAGVGFTVGAADLPGGITVAGLTTLTIRYQVVIPTP